MRGWLQRIRGAIGIGVTWAAGWAPIGAAVGTVLHWLLPGAGGLGGVIVLNATTFAALGFVGGALFATVLRLTEGRRRFDELRVPRFAGWGAVGGLLLGGIAAAAGLWGGGFGVLGAGMMGAATLLGAGSAAATLPSREQPVTAPNGSRAHRGTGGRERPRGTMCWMLRPTTSV